MIDSTLAAAIARMDAMVALPGVPESQREAWRLCRARLRRDPDVCQQCGTIERICRCEVSQPPISRSQIDRSEP